MHHCCLHIICLIRFWLNLYSKLCLSNVMDVICKHLHILKWFNISFLFRREKNMIMKLLAHMQGTKNPASGFTGEISPFQWNWNFEVMLMWRVCIWKKCLNWAWCLNSVADSGEDGIAGSVVSSPSTFIFYLSLHLPLESKWINKRQLMLTVSMCTGAENFVCPSTHG